MSYNKHLNPHKILYEKSYPLPKDFTSTRSKSSVACSNVQLGLGVNTKTGRLQWCPGFTCCKLFFLISVIMLPITIILMVLLRVDGLLNMLEGENYTFHNMLSNKDWFAPYGFNMENNQENNKQTNYEDIEQYPIKPRWNDWTDFDERHILEDAKTSFLPHDLHVPSNENTERNKQNSLNYPPTFEKIINYFNQKQRRRRRNLQLNNKQNDDVRNHSEGSQKDSNTDILTGTKKEFIVDDDISESAQNKNTDDDIAKNIASLESYWNEQGTRSSIRKTQASTMLQYMDKRVNPCNDFYRFACGNWEAAHPIPRDKAGFDTFEMLRESLDAVLKQLLESPTAPPPFHSVKRRQAEFSNPEVTEKGKSLEEVYENQQSNIGDSTTFVDNDPDSQIEKESEESPDQVREALNFEEDLKVPMQLSEILQRVNRQTTNSQRKRKNHLSLSLSKKLGEASITKTPNYDAVQSASVKAKYLYQSCINSKILSKRGIEPLHRLISDLGGWPVLTPDWAPESFDWLYLAAILRRFNNDILIVQWVGPDIKNSDENIVQFDQTSLGLPTREYFLQPINAKYLSAYKRFMTDVMQKMGAPKHKAETTANELIAFETKLAGITAPAELRLNVTKLYKRMSLQDLSTLIPEINWIRYLSILQDRLVLDNEEVVIFATNYMKDLVNLISTTPPTTLSNYMIWRFVRHRINNVDDRFDETKQHFYHALFGREESPSRWKVCVAQVNTNMGMAVGSMFVSRYFDENSKSDTLQMTHEIQNAFRNILESTDWIDNRTKRLAEEKVNAMSLKIGYPDFILDSNELDLKYHDLHIHPEKYFENTLNVLLHAAKSEQNRLLEKVNKTHWQTAPAIVNAYYSRNKNQIMFPAGILQPPFYHRHFPRALNFGGIGVVIGHELTHGFDDKGRLFDSNGNIHKWWSDYSIRGFDSRARCIISQYSNYTVPEVGITLNGESTQGENIADNGGLRQAFRAYSSWLQSNPEEMANENLPGINMTGPQLFFLNFGQVWCGTMRPEAMRNKLNTAIHSPGRFRVIGTLSNSYDFAKVFNCPKGSPMNPDLKCNVW